MKFINTIIEYHKKNRKKGFVTGMFFDMAVMIVIIFILEFSLNTISAPNFRADWFIIPSYVILLIAYLWLYFDRKKDYFLKKETYKETPVLYLMIAFGILSLPSSFDTCESTFTKYKSEYNSKMTNWIEKRRSDQISTILSAGQVQEKWKKYKKKYNCTQNF